MVVFCARRLFGFGRFDPRKLKLRKFVNLETKEVFKRYLRLGYSFSLKRSSFSDAKGKLLEWLENFVVPEEQKFSDKDFTRQRAMEFSDKLFRCGTLSGAVYSSIHSDTFAIAQEHFRGHFIVGNVVMTHNSPIELTQSKDTIFSH